MVLTKGHDGQTESAMGTVLDFLLDEDGIYRLTATQGYFLY